MTAPRPRARVLFLFSDTGGGHRSVARAIARRLVGLDGGHTTCAFLDFFSVVAVPILRWSSRVYPILATRCLGLYNLLFLATNNRPSMRLAAKVMYRLARWRIARMLATESPDVVVVTHPLLISHLVCMAREEFGFNFHIVTVVSDLVSAHASWACPAVDLCVVGTLESYQ